MKKEECTSECDRVVISALLSQYRSHKHSHKLPGKCVSYLNLNQETYHCQAATLIRVGIVTMAVWGKLILVCVCVCVNDGVLPLANIRSYVFPALSDSPFKLQLHCFSLRQIRKCFSVAQVDLLKCNYCSRQVKRQHGRRLMATFNNKMWSHS